MKFDIVPVLCEFSHEVTADKITIMRDHDDGRTLLKQLEDGIQKQIDGA